MNQKIRESIDNVLDTLEPKEFSNICEKIKYKDGKELIVNMVEQRLNDFPAWDFERVINDVELTLKTLNTNE